MKSETFRTLVAIAAACSLAACVSKGSTWAANTNIDLSAYKRVVQNEGQELFCQSNWQWNEPRRTCYTRAQAEDHERALALGIYDSGPALVGMSSVYGGTYGPSGVSGH